MRFTEFRTLLEYDRSKTQAALGNSIIKAAGRDSYLKSRNLDDAQTVAAVIDAAESADPTQNKQYVQWIVRQFTKQGMRYEDLYKLKADLSVFAKTKGQHKRLGINSDINQYDWRALADTAKKLGQPTRSGSNRLQLLWTTATNYNRVVCKTRRSFYWTVDKFSRHKNTNTVVLAVGIKQ